MVKPESHDVSDCFPNSQQARIRECGERFEAAWEQYFQRQPATPRPEIKTYLEGRSASGRAELFRKLLHLDVVYRRKASEKPTQADYRARFPEFETIIGEVLSENVPSIGDFLSTNDLNGSADTDATEGSTRRDREPVPKTIGRYEVLAELGRGGFGRVYRAHDPQLNRDVAIKVPLRHRISSPEDVKRFLNEARILAEFNHPRIVQVFDAGTLEDGYCFVVSQWVDGTDLAQLIHEARPSVEESAELVAGIADALQEAHQLKIVHRDIKPANILIDRKGRPYLADFGLALSDEDFGSVEFQGLTPVYASPEQASGESHLVDGRSDIFSLGVVLYELLTGERPFVGRRATEVLERIKTVDARPPRQLDPSIPRELERICLKALARRRKDRYNTAQDMADDLRHHLQHPDESVAAPSIVVPKIFVSYRREDTTDFSGRLCDRLRGHYGEEAVFHDVASMAIGIDYRLQIEQTIIQCRVLVVVIGPEWLAARADGTRRLDDAQDPVRFELETAFARDKMVIPVLVGDTPMPSEQHLPTSLKKFADIQACSIDRGQDFTIHVERLVAAIDQAVEKADGPAEPIPTGGYGPVVPKKPRVEFKGLRAFDEQDADSFLQLLPGQPDRDGLPESIRFWKTRIEQTDLDKTFCVGLIIGPSGCGKSSMISAGLLPCLAEHVVRIRVESTGTQTESRLLASIRKHLPDIPQELTLKQTFSGLRRCQFLRTGQKVLIVLDQFEQWLHSHDDDERGELVEALRQCDGTHVQCLTIVRDDFMMRINEFFEQLEVDIDPGKNWRVVDLFSIDHAQHVLRILGQANGDLPEPPGNLTTDQESFVTEAVDDLAQKGKVNCVRLALLAQMMRGRPWTRSSLKSFGGLTGLGEAFLEETFTSVRANPKHHSHEAAARTVLSALLPERGGDIKGRMRSSEELRTIADTARPRRDFDVLLHILDPELRLITPTDPTGQNESAQTLTDSATPTTARFYQLTHDYLVSSLRNWLTRLERKTFSGRARLRLRERSAQWNRSSEGRYLPAWWETLNIWLFVRKRSWTDAQHKMMGAARRRLLSQCAIVVAAFALTATGYQWLRQEQRIVEFRRRLTQSEQRPARIVDICESLLAADRLPAQKAIQSELNRIGDDAESAWKLRLAQSVLRQDIAQVKEVLCDAEPNDFVVILKAIGAWDHTDEVVESLGESVRDDDAKLSQRFRAYVAIRKIAADMPDDATDLSALMARQFIIECDKTRNPSTWYELIRPVSLDFQGELEAIHARGTDYGLAATRALVSLGCASSAAALDRLRDSAVDLVQIAELSRLMGKGKRSFRKEVMSMADRLAVIEDSGERAREATRVAIFILTSLEDNRIDTDDFVNVLTANHQAPELRTELIRIASLQVYRPDTLSMVEWCESKAMADADPSALSALVQIFGSYLADDLRKSLRQRAIQSWHRLLSARDVEVRSSVIWALKNQGMIGDDDHVRQSPIDASATKDREWYLTSTHGHQMAVVDGGDFVMGSPTARNFKDQLVAAGDAAGFTSEFQQAITIPRRFSIATMEVTVKQLREFIKESDLSKLEKSQVHPSVPTKLCPAWCNWHVAAAYCNWLSRKENLGECYEIISQHPLLLIPKDNHLEVEGYRLPTEAEWEFACRADTKTSRFFGEGHAPEAMDEHAWYVRNSENASHPVGLKKPNSFGLFDMLGNVWEWCDTPYRSNSKPNLGSVESDGEWESVPFPRSFVFRGGAWNENYPHIRSAVRGWEPPDRVLPNLGFRVARTLLTFDKPH